MKKSKKNILKFLGVVLISFGILYYNIPLNLNYALAAPGVPEILVQQARLLDASGNLLGGSGTDYCFRFSIYSDSAVGAPDTKLWPSGTPSTMTVNVKNGVFDVGIGDTAAGGDTLNYNFQDSDEIYLNVEVENTLSGSCAGVTFGAEDNLSPRQRIVSSGYAINASTLGGFSASQAAGANQIPVFDGSGNLVASGALTVSSGGSSSLTLNSASGRVSVAAGDFLGLSVAGISGAAAGDIWYDSLAGKYKINEGGTTKVLCNTTDAGCGAGGSTTWDTIGDATGDGTIELTSTEQIMNWTDFTTTAFDGITFNFDNNGGTAGTDSGLVINNAISTNTTGDTNTENLLLIQQLDTTGTGTTIVDNAVKIDSAGSSAITDAIEITNSAGNLTNAINIVDTGGGAITTGVAFSGTFTNIFDIGGTTLSGPEITILDSGINYGELTDSGTLTATTVDINGGNIDGTTIGASSAAAGTFTTVTGNTSVSTPTLSLTGTGTINGLDAVDPTGEDTIEALIFDADAQNITGTWEAQDDVNLAFGTDADWLVQYNDGVDDQLLFITANTAATAITDPMVEFLVGATPTADQQVFGVAKGTQSSNTPLFTIDEDGDVVAAGTIAGSNLSGTNTGDQTNITGNAGTVTFADAGADTTTFVALGIDATGNLSPATDAGLTYNASTNALTAATFIGALTGNVTGNVSGSAATVTGASQSAITSLGTLTALNVDNINIDGNTISSTAGTDLLITPLAGQQIVLDGAIVIDAGVVTGATSISSTGFTGALTGNADTATALQTSRTIGGVSFNGTANITVASATGGFAVSGGNLTLADDLDFAIGSGSDWLIQYDEGVDDQLLFITANTAATAITDPMVEFLVGATPTADQQVFGVAKGTQSSNTPLFTIDEDGDVVAAGTIAAGSGNEVITLSTGKIDADAITLDGSGSTATTSSRSGLEVDSNGLTMIQGCADGQLLQWTDAGGWACDDDNTSAGSGITTVQEGDSTIEGSAGSLDFDAEDFAVTSAPAGEANVAFDYASTNKLADGVTFALDGDGSPTADLFSIGSGDATLTDGVDGLVVSLDQGPGTTLNNSGINLTVSSVDDDSILNALTITMNNSSFGSTQRGLNIVNSDTVSNAITENLIFINNAETTASTLEDGILITSSGVNNGITDAIDVSDDNIDNALNIGANEIEGTSATINFTDFDVTSTGGLTMNDILTVNDDLTVALTGNENVEITDGATPTTDTISVVSNGATVTADANALEIDFTTGDGASVTNSGLQIDLASGGTAAGDIINGINITMDAADDSTQNAITIGADFDKQINGNGWSVDGSGNLTVTSCAGCGGGGGTLQQSYEAGETIAIDSTNGALVIDAASANFEVKSGEGADTGDIRFHDGTDNWLFVDESADTMTLGVAAGSGITIGATGITTTVPGSLIVTQTLDSNGDVSIADTNIALDGASTTLTVTGAFTVNPGGTMTLGDNGDALIVNASDFDVSSGQITGATDETINGIDINAGAVSDIIDLALVLGAGNDLTINADTTNNTQTSGVLNIDVGTVTDTARAADITIVNDDEGGAADTIYGLVVNVDDNATTTNDTVYGIYIDSLSNGSPENPFQAASSLLVLDNSDGDDAIADGILFASAGGGFTDFIDTPSSVFRVSGAGDLTIAGGDITGANAEFLDIGETDNGSIIFGGAGETNNEAIEFDFETTANTVGISSSTGVTTVDFGSIGITVASCTGCGGGGTLDSAYEAGNDITTSDARDIDFVLADTAGDSNFDIDIEADNTVTITRNATASAENPNQLLLVENADGDITLTNAILVQTNGGAITDGLEITNTSGNLTNAINIIDTGGGTLDKAIVISGTIGTAILDTPSIDITGAGAITGATGVSTTTVTASSTIAANGGITFDAASDTIGSFTAGGTILMNSNVIQDIGATGTDFLAGGGLTLDDILTVNDDLTVALTGNENVEITDGATPTTDTISVVADGATTTDDVNALEIDFTTGDGTDVTNSALKLDLVSGGTTAGDIIYGINLTMDAVNDSTQTAMNIGANFDNGIVGTTFGSNIFDFTNFDVTSDGAIDVAGTITAGSGDEIITLSTGKIDADAITLAPNSGAGSSASDSGLETGSDGLTMIQGCLDGQLLEWTDAGGWACADDNTSAGAGISTVQEEDSTIDGAADTLDFNGEDFIVTSSPAGEVNISFDYAATNKLADAITFNIDGDGSPTADLVSIGAGDTTVTNGADGLVVSLTQGSGSALTNAGINLLVSSSDDDSTLNGLTLTMTNASTGGTQRGLNIVNANDAANAVTENLIFIDNAETTASTLTDAILITSSGVNNGITDAIDVSAANIDNALNIGANEIEGTTATINFDNFDVASDGNITVDPDVGLDTNAAGALELGIANATSMTLCNSAACDTITIGTNTDADTITIGDSTDNVAITGDSWSITDAGALTVASCTGCGGPTTKYLVNTHTIASTTATEVSEMSATLTAGTYTFKYYLIVQSSSTTVGMGLGVNYTGTADSFVAIQYYIDTGTTTTAGSLDDTVTGAGAEQMVAGGATRVESTTSPNLNVITAVPAQNVNAYIAIEGVMVVSDGGDIELWHNSDTTTDTSVMAGSSVLIQKITAGADLAEIYSTLDSTVGPGDIVSLDTNLKSGVMKSNKPYDSKVFGIVSTSPSLVMGTMDDKEAMPVLVAMSGRVPVKVTNENGPIKFGDLLASSSTPGVAMRATKAGQIIGQAMGEFDGEGVGKVMAFVKTDYSNGATLAELLPGLMQGGVVSPTADTSVFALSMLLENRENLENTVDISEITADRITAGLEVITPRVVAKEILTDRIASVIGEDLTVNLSPEGEFVIRGPDVANEDGTKTESDPVVTFDALGNAVFMGDVRAASVTADKISGLEIFTDKISVLTSSLASIEGSVTDFVSQGDLEILKTAQTQLSDYQSSISVRVSEIASLIDGLNNLYNEFKTEVENLKTADRDIASRIVILEQAQSINTDKLNGEQSLNVMGSSVLAGGLQVDTVSSIGEILTFNSDVSFFGRPYFTTDTAGFATIKQNQRKVDIVFEKEYIEQPIVNATIAIEGESQQALEESIFNNDTRYVITNKTVKGFTILLNRPAPNDIPFSWIALAVKGAKTFTSVADSPASVQVAAPTPAVEPTQEPTSEITSEPTTEPSPEPASETSVPEESTLSEPATEPLELTPVVENVSEPESDQEPAPKPVPVESASEPEPPPPAE